MSVWVLQNRYLQVVAICSTKEAAMAYIDRLSQEQCYSIEERLITVSFMRVDEHRYSAS